MSRQVKTVGPAAGHREKLLAAIPLSERRRELAGVSTVVLEGGDGPPEAFLHAFRTAIGSDHVSEEK